MVEMKILSSHEEWLKNRMNGIGGSEISAVIGCNPYMTNVDLWELKTGRRQAEDISEKPYVKYGNQAEMYLRGLFRLDFPEYKVDYIENNSFRNEKYPWALASLDGWITDKDGRKGILEIKTSEVLSSQHREKWKGDHVPMNYYCQTIFYMAVLEADFACIKAQLKTVFDGIPYLQTKHYFIEKSDVLDDINYLMSEGEKFWQCVKNNVQPPLMLPEI
jgi:putative phage-type endonuclease